MFDRFLRDLKDRLLAPLARALGPGCSPTAVSFVSFIFGLGCAVLILRHAYGWALAAWAVSRMLDGLDGTLAREHGRTTDLGGYLDLLLDFIVYAAIPMALVAAAPSSNRLWALGFLLATFYVNAASWMYLAAVLERRRQGVEVTGEGTTVTMPPGLIGGTETILFYAAFMVWPHLLPSLFLLMGMLVLAGVAQRALWAWRGLTKVGPWDRGAVEPR